MAGFVCLGDSLTEGYLSTNKYPTQLAAITGLPAINQGVDGKTLASMDTDYATITGPAYNSSTANILVIEGGGNDIYAGATVSDIDTSVRSICTKARATGYSKIFILTQTNIPDGPGGAWQTTRLAMNADRRAHWSEYADGIVDVAWIPQLSGNGSDTTYFADTVHWTAAGDTLVAQEVADVVAGKYKLYAGSGAFNITGYDAKKGVGLLAGSGRFTLTGSAAFSTGSPTIVLNPSDRDPNITIAAGWKTVTLTSTAGQNAYNIRSNLPIATGRYAEVVFPVLGTSVDHTPGIALANLSQLLSTYPGGSSGASWFQNGYAEWPGSGFMNNFGGFAANDVLGIYNLGTSVNFYKNGTFVGSASNVPAGDLYLMVSLANLNDSATANFGPSGILYLPAGALPANGSAPGMALGSGKFRFGQGNGDFNQDDFTEEFMTGADRASMGVGMPLGSGSFGYTGHDATFGIGHGMALGSGTFVITGGTANLHATVSAIVQISGPPITLIGVVAGGAVQLFRPKYTAKDQPKNTTTRLSMPFAALLKRADPDFYRDRQFEPGYEFEGRDFEINVSRIYNTDPNGNLIPV